MGDPVSPAGWDKLAYLAVLVLVSTFPVKPAAAGGDATRQQGKEKAFMVQEYRYEPPQGDNGNLDIGQSLCGTRCNAISDNFGSYLKPRNWRLVKIAGGVERSVALDNPFLKGNCICVGDEYLIDWYDPMVPQDRAGAVGKQAQQ